MAACAWEEVSRAVQLEGRRGSQGRNQRSWPLPGHEQAWKCLHGSMCLRERKARCPLREAAAR